MTYQETLDYLYSQLPMYQRVGGAAYKKDLTNTIAMCRALGNPQHGFKSVHVAGTNGKGSSSHAIASVLQAAGYKTALYTSPHLKDFTERIRINGQPIPQDRVVEWVQANRSIIDHISPSFFELTVGLAFDYFKREKVDIAIIEVGMGGRLDSTNIINPLVSIITRIGLDHTQFLGNSLPEIAAEKAGIIKAGVPVVIGTWQSTEIQEVFEVAAKAKQSTIVVADTNFPVYKHSTDTISFISPASGLTITCEPDIKAEYYKNNIPGVLAVLNQLQKLGYAITDDSIRNGLSSVINTTGLKGRYQILQQQPKIIADVSHNPDGLQPLFEQISNEQYSRLHIVLGVVADKDLVKALPLFPATATYYFTAAQLPRALPATELAHIAKTFNMEGNVFATVAEAVHAAKNSASPEDLILITGSTFVVAEVPDL